MNQTSRNRKSRHWTITIHATGKPRDVDVFLYDKIGHLRSAATKFANAWSADGTNFSDTEAICHGVQKIHVAKDGTETEEPLAVILRFARGRNDPVIVAHEVAHAAQHLYRLDCLDDRPAEEHFYADNETFAYLLSELFETVSALVAESDDTP